MIDADWIDTAEAARRLGVSKVWVTILIKRGKLRAKKLNPRAFMVDAESVERLREERSKKQEDAPE